MSQKKYRILISHQMLSYSVGWLKQYHQ